MTPEADIGILDVISMLGLFITAFAMWVAWELITGRKLLAAALAVATFLTAWAVAAVSGAEAPWQVLIVEGITTAVLIRVANGARRENAR